MLSPEFLFAGRASFVFESPQGEHVTVSVRQRKDDPRFSISLRHMNAPWKYAGSSTVEDMTASGRITKTHKSQLSTAVPEDVRLMTIASYAMKLIANSLPIPTGYRLAHTGRCGKCGKLLRDAESTALGLGPVCRGDR